MFPGLNLSSSAASLPSWRSFHFDSSSTEGYLNIENEYNIISNVIMMMLINIIFTSITYQLHKLNFNSINSLKFLTRFAGHKKKWKKASRVLEEFANVRTIRIHFCSIIISQSSCNCHFPTLFHSKTLRRVILGYQR